MGRRSVIIGGLGGCFAVCKAGAARQRKLTIIEAPTNLGLRQLREGHVPGTWRAPAALNAAGLSERLVPVATRRLPRPIYQAAAQPGTRIRNGQTIRAFSLALAREVKATLAIRQFPLVIGGDCSVLLGCLHGAGGVGLVHVDGHSDFYHPGNHARSRLGTAAGMDLALATGRGEPLLTIWDGRVLVHDRDVVQIGERDELSPDFAYRDIQDTEIERLPVRWVLSNGIGATVRRALSAIHGRERQVWLHVDLDVLDQRCMPAVDSPGSPGLSFDELRRLISGLLRSGRVIGADVSIYDPDLDENGEYAGQIVACLGAAFSESI